MGLSKQGTILVTGGAGFIGSALVWALNRRGHDNIIVSDFLGKDDKWKNLAPLRFQDYIDADDLLEHVVGRQGALGDLHTIFHLGACSATTEKDARYLMKNNFEYTKEMAHWAVDRKARFVYASSAATYGDGAQGMDDRDPDLGKLRPMNAYGYSKHLFDVYAEKAGISNATVGLKYFNVFGPNEAHKGGMRSLVHKAFEQIRDTGKVQLFRSHRPDFADGEQRRDFLYVKDAVEMTIFLAERPLGGGVFNLGSGMANSWLELTRAIFAALGMQPNIEFIDIPEEIRDGYQYFTQANTTKLRSAGYNQQVTPLSEAVADYVCNYLLPGNFLGDEPQDAQPAPVEVEESAPKKPGLSGFKRM